MTNEYQVRIGLSANSQVVVKEYYEDGKLINPPIPTDDMGRKIFDAQMESARKLSKFKDITTKVKIS